MTSPDALLAELCAPFADNEKVHLNNAGVAPMTARAEKALVDTASLMREGYHAIPRLLQRYEHARAVFAGLVGCDDDDVAFFQTCAAALTQAAFGLPIEKGQNIVILDQEYPSNAYPWFRAAERAGGSVVVVPSRWPEVCPTIVVQALAHGRPVLATDRGGLPFLLGTDGGWLVPPTPGALADGLRHAVADAPRRTATARSRYLARMAPAVVVGQITGVYRRIVGN